jgi:dual-specificity kinase
MLTPPDYTRAILGSGVSGYVISAHDQHMRWFAIKVSHFLEAAEHEYRILKTLAAMDPGKGLQFVQPVDFFIDKGRSFLVTEILGSSLFDFLKRNNFAPFPLPHVKQIARQLFDGIQCKVPPSFRHGMR